MSVLFHSGTPVPWLSWKEWESVKRGFFANDPTLLKVALDHVRFCLNGNQAEVSVWKARGKVPTAVEATSNFMERLLHERLEHSTFYFENFTRLEHESRLMYGIALIRFDIYDSL